MSDQTPAPLVPADVDLRDFAFMPLDVRRLRDSSLVAKKKADEALAAILLWCASWHQQPASSIPDDDFELAQLAGYGRAAKEFRRIRVGALHGFIHCSDGRFYHPVVAEKAAEAWNRKLESEWRRACDRVRKENKDRKEKGEAEHAMPGKPVYLIQQEFFGIARWVYGNSNGTTPPGTRNPHLKGQGQGEGQGQGTVPETTDSPLRSESSTVIRLGDKAPGRSVAAWNAYAAAYEEAYGVTPLRNSTTNAQMARFVSLVGAEDAPAVAAFYLTCRSSYYVQHRHPVGAMLKDASGLYTQWKTGNRSTQTEARQADRSSATLDAVNALLIEAAQERRKG